MKNLQFVLGISLMLMLSVSQADNCASLSAEITDKMEQMSNADTDVLDRAQKLHDEGMTLHNAGDHASSVVKLDEALQILVEAE